MTRKLGSVQRDVLDSMQRHGAWHANCGWIWSTYSGTVRVMESLVRAGYVARVEEKPPRGGTRNVYHLTDRGRAALATKED